MTTTRKIGDAEVVIAGNIGAVGKSLCSLVETAANEAIATEDIFKIGVSGGSLVKLLAEGLAVISTDWSKWRFFFCDERIVPFNDVESTFGAYKAHFIGKIPVTEDQFMKVDPEFTAKEAAQNYIKQMSLYFPPDSVPRFDLLILGMGPDGHTCSLFPKHRLLDETSLWVCAITDSPKPPPARITLTLPVINNAKCCIFSVTGAAKASMVKRVLVDKENVPATSIQPIDGKLYWILDREAASEL